MDYKNFVNISFKNRKLLEQSQLCGCYYCCKIYPTSKIKEWTDRGETAICPCGIDSVVPVDVKDHEEMEVALKLARKLFFY